MILPAAPARRRCVPAVAVAALCALALAACGSSSATGGSASGGSAVRAATATASSAATSTTSGGGSGSADSAAIIKSIREASKDKKSVVMKMQVATPDQQPLNATIKMTTSPKRAMQYDMKTAEGDIQVIVLDKTIYMMVPSAAKGMWFKLAANGKDQLSESFKPMFDAFDDKLSVDQLTTGLDDAKITKKGTATLDGDEVTVYEVTDSTASKVLMYVDSDNLMRKFEALGGSQGKVTVTYSGWGEPVTITAPPANKVFDASKLGNP